MVKRKSQEKQIIYFDTCVLLDCISLSRGCTYVNSNKKFDISTINSEKAEILVSNINIIELSEKLRDAKASEIALAEGYSYFELNKTEIEKIDLDIKELKKIADEIQEKILDLPAVASIGSEGFRNEDMGNLTGFCLNYSIFMIDAIHFMLADRGNCDVFVTSDKALHNALKKFLSIKNISNSIKLETAKSFIQNHLQNLKN